jgi:hypothetical protein
MKNKIQILIIVFSIISLTINGQSNTFTGKIKGHVIGLDKKPVNNVTVKLYNLERKYLDSSLTNEAGVFEFDNLAGSIKYTIKVLPDNERGTMTTGVQICNGKITFVDLKIGLPCDFFLGDKPPICKHCNKLDNVIPIKYVDCFGAVKPYIKNGVLIKCKGSLCHSDWYCTKCEMEL